MNRKSEHRGLKLMIGIFVVLCCAMIPMTSFAADVNVYAEGAYDNGQLKLYIYADITAAPILSFGVKVFYPSSMTYAGAVKNEEVWYIGDGTNNTSYMDPENQGDGVVIIGGKLKTSAPTEGVSGDRVLLGTVTLNYSGDPDVSGISLDLGRDNETYKNFVDNTGAVKDGAGVDFVAVNIAESGDANADGSINSLDAQMVRAIFFGNMPWTVFADCNADGNVNSLDAQCIRHKFFN